jgi:hypothetical protein
MQMARPLRILVVDDNYDAAEHRKPSVARSVKA